MGQQQLLLIVLGVILVGVAVVLGIQYFGTGAEEGAKDELVAHSMIVASNAQQWLKKPIAMGGGGGSFIPGGADASGTDPNYDIPARMKSSTNGTYEWASTADTVGTITATPSTNTGYTWEVTTTVTPNTVATVIGEQE